MESDLQDKKILLVEDDKFLAELLNNYLTKNGLQIIYASNGAECDKKIKETKPSLILLDLLLPDIDGYAILKKLKEDPEFKDIPVIILSNLGQKDEIKHGLDLGAESFLVKANFDMSDILLKIKSSLGQLK